MHRIDQIHAHEILDSRGNPTLTVSVLTNKGALGQASVPSGASTGAHEAHELRDGDKSRYRGLGVRKAVNHVNRLLASKLRGMPIADLQAIDARMIDLDGTPNKSHLGANAILGVSMACAHAGARAKGWPLYAYLRTVYGLALDTWRMPMPLMNIFNGGRHADTNLDIQEFIIVPIGIKTTAERVRAGSEVFHALGDVLREAGKDTDVGNEGGYAPEVGKTEQALDYIMQAIRRAKYRPGKHIGLGLDVAASEFFDEKTKRYVMRTDRKKLTEAGMIALMADWVDRYPFVSIEDPLAEDAWEGWKECTRQLGKRVLLIGDDLFVTNPTRLAEGIRQGVANTILVKPNQIGTVTETMETIALARAHRYKVVLSHRSGETADTTIADMAVAVNADFLKAGAPSRSERLVKYNRLMEIEEEVRQSHLYA
jgi:enolase